MADDAPTPLLAYHADPRLKEATLAQMRAHREHDDLVQGTYWERGRGCAVGCLTHDPHGGHELYPIRWGIPEILARLEDRIFEGLALEQARLWPERFLDAIPVGADLSGAWPRFAHAMLVDPERGVARLCAEGSAPRAAVERVAGLFERVNRREELPATEWAQARAAAYAAAAARREHYAWLANLLCRLLAEAAGHEARS